VEVLFVSVDVGVFIEVIGEGIADVISDAGGVVVVRFLLTAK
jgi:hypothetical protein